MVTNEERKQIAARLRRFESDEVSSYSEYLEKLDEIIGINGCEETGSRLADLIEPEPERTCKNLSTRKDDFGCSVCECEVVGCMIDDFGSWDNPLLFCHCPNCGARVVENLWNKR